MAAPLTGFESRGHIAPWTTFAEEATFLSDLTAYTDAITLTTAGESVNGNPMRVLTIGTGPRTILFTGQQHGAELAGREALLTTLRLWADSDDADLAAYLDAVTVVMMPTCHPDNQAIRENANGVNLNRDHVQLTQPETQAIHAVIRDWQPDIIVDLHEGQDVATDTATGVSEHPNLDSEIMTSTLALESAVKSEISTAGYSWARYLHQANGPEYLHGWASMCDRVGLLLETRRVAGDDTDAAARHDAHVRVIDAVWRWHATQVDAIAATVTAAQARQATSTDTITLLVGTETTGPTVDPVPNGYVVGPTGWQTLAVTRDRFGLDGVDVTGQFWMPTSQHKRRLLLYLVAPASPLALVAGAAADAPPAPVPAVPIGTPIGFRVRVDGVTYNATIKGWAV